MNIHFDSVDFDSDSGPNNFASKLSPALKRMGHKVVRNVSKADIQLCFTRRITVSKLPFVQRLDGISFNSNSNFKIANADILQCYRKASAVIIQSNFDRKLIDGFFGERKNRFIIHNGTDLSRINAIPSSQMPELDQYKDVWTCASLWLNRPNKRLKDNIRYFMENSSEEDCMVVCGKTNTKSKIDRVFFLGQLSWHDMISIFKRTKHFVHLALVDHCPNVVVDAMACGCHVICSSLSGTEEIAGKDCTVIEDKKWDFQTPFNYKNPPLLDFNKKRNGLYNNSINIDDVAQRYVEVFEKVLA